MGVVAPRNTRVARPIRAPAPAVAKAPLEAAAPAPDSRN
jgi:hypothetical protein